jgi:hypothetical protein
MQLTIGANCWDGARRISLTKEVEVLIRVVENKSSFIDKLSRGSKRLNYPKVKRILGYAAPLILLLNGLPPFGIMSAFAQSVGVAPTVGGAISTAAKTKILHAFDPLIEMIQSLSYPIAGVMIAGGCLFIMVGNRERGMQMLQNAAIGYILVQLAPMLLSLLVGVGSTL